MPEDTTKLQATRMIMTAAAVVVVVTGLKLAQDFFIPVLLAAFIATVSFPITSWLRNHRVPRPLAVLLTVLVDFAFLSGIVVIVVTLLGDLDAKWQNKYSPAMSRKVDEVSESAVRLMEKWNVPGTQVEESVGTQEGPGSPSIGDPPNPTDPSDGTDSPQVGEEGTTEDPVATPLVVSVPKKVRDYSDFFAQKISESINPFALGKDVAFGVIGFLGTTLLILILTVFMLSEARMFGRRANAVLEAHGPNLDRIMSATADIQRYLAMKTVVSLVTGFLAGFLCWAAGLDFFILWGIVAFALNFIPVLGSIIAGIPPLILAFLVDGPASALAVGIGYISINIFLGNFLEPMLMGRRFGLSTLVVIVSVLFWGFVWGPVGMFLAVPLTMILKVMLDNSEELRWMAVAITKEKRHPILIPDDEDDDDPTGSILDPDLDLSGIVPDSRS